MTLTTGPWPEDASLRPDYPALPLFGWLMLAIGRAVALHRDRLGRVTSGYMPWLCRSIRGNAAFDFTGSGLAILWHTVVFVVLCSLILADPVDAALARLLVCLAHHRRAGDLTRSVARAR